MRDYQDMVFTTAVRLLADEAEAEDTAQKVFLKAYDHFAMLVASPAAGGWLKTVTTRLCLNHLRRYRGRWRFFSELRSAESEGGEKGGGELDLAAPDVFFAEIDSTDRREAMERALARLPDRQRVPLVLYHFQDQSYEEIARHLGISLAKVKTDILRGRAALAKILVRPD
jgi:RNA polymerase sigma-70 factor (ECF subfamily)